VQCSTLWRFWAFFTSARSAIFCTLLTFSDSEDSSKIFKVTLVSDMRQCFAAIAHIMRNLGDNVGKVYETFITRKALRERRPPPSMLTARLVSISSNFRITPKIKPLVACAIFDIPSKFQKDPFITFWVILLTHRQTDKQTNKVWQKHYLLGRGKHQQQNKMARPAQGSHIEWKFTI